jgi:hypothetical protein
VTAGDWKGPTQIIRELDGTWSVLFEGEFMGHGLTLSEATTAMDSYVALAVRQAAYEAAQQLPEWLRHSRSVA